MKTIRINDNMVIVSTIDDVTEVKNIVKEWSSRERVTNPVYQKVSELAQEGDEWIKKATKGIDIPNALSFSGILSTWLDENSQFISTKQYNWLAKKVEIINKYKTKKPQPKLEVFVEQSEETQLPF